MCVNRCQRGLGLALDRFLRLHGKWVGVVFGVAEESGPQFCGMFFVLQPQAKLEFLCSSRVLRTAPGTENESLMVQKSDVMARWLCSRKLRSTKSFIHRWYTKAGSNFRILS